MKKELEDLREIATSLVTTKLTFDQRRRFFEKKVEEKLSVDNDVLYMIPATDHYSLAKDIINDNTTLIIAISNVRAKHPKYGNSRLKEETMKIMKEKLYSQDNFISDSNNLELEKLVNTYFLYEECGVLDIIEAEESLTRRIKETDVSLDNVLGENELVKTVKSGVMSVICSDNENMKSQIFDVKEEAKGLVNKSSKKLIKLFEHVVDKTNPDE